ncbi:hypothetical protein AS157_05220 [Thermosipho sp. 1244]|nr:hypothetical protein [Thermosipho sp. 1244]
MLLAIRMKDSFLKVLENIGNKNSVLEFNFKERKLPKNEIKKIVEFFDKTGLKKLFLETNMKNIQDYMLGVEVGMDTNARKNRSGKIMEQVIESIISKITKQSKTNEINILSQIKFKKLEKFNIHVNQAIAGVFQKIKI